MGFKRKRKLYALDFTGTSLEGLEMVMHGLTISEAMTLSRLRALGDAPEEEQAEGIEGLFVFVAGKVKSWNLEDDDGQPIEPSAEELMSWDAGEAFLAIERWQSAVEGIPDPLGQRSNGGSTREESSLPPLPTLS